MKRFFPIFLVLFCGISLLSAQASPQPTSEESAPSGFEVQRIAIKTKSPLISLILEYTPVTQTLVAVYTVKHLPFDEGDALMAIRDSIVSFAGENDYRTYKPCAKDVIKYRSNETQITRMVILSK